MSRITPFFYVLLCVASYWNSDPVTNDFERFQNHWLLASFLALFVVLLAIYGTLIESDTAPTRRTIWLVFAGCAVPLLASFPVGSKDVFFYAFYGKMWGAHGLNPYLTPPSTLSNDDWYRFLPLWTDNPVVYGPLFTLQTRLLYAVSGSALTGAIAAQKLANLSLLVVSSFLILRLRIAVAAARGEAFAPTRTLALWLWSPLILFEAIGSGHNDLAMATLILAAALLWVRGNATVAVVLLAASFWYKWYSIALVPAWIIWSVKRWGARTAIRGCVIGALGATALSLAVLASFFGSAESAVSALFHAVIAPFYVGGEADAGVRLIFPDELPPPLWVIFRILHAFGLMDRSLGATMFDGLRIVGFIAGLLWIARRSVEREVSPAGFLADLGWSLVLFFAFIPPLMWPWYLISLCALAMAVGDRPSERAVLVLAATGLLGYFFTFTPALFLVVALGALLTALRGVGSTRSLPPET